MPKRLLPCCLALLFAALLSPSQACAQEPVPTLPDSDALPPPTVRTRLVLLGTGMTLGFYGAAVGASLAWPDDPGAADLRIPFAGPWLKLSQTRLCEDLPEASSRCNNPLQIVGAVASVLGGVGQIGGTIFFLEGAFMKVRARQRGARRTGLTSSAPYHASSAPHADILGSGQPRGGWQVGTVHLWPTPYATGSGAGFGLIGTF